MSHASIEIERPVYDVLRKRMEQLPSGKPRTFTNVIRMLLTMPIMDERRGRPKKNKIPK